MKNRIPFIDDRTLISGDKTNKSMYIVNETDFLVQSLNVCICRLYLTKERCHPESTF